MQGASILNIHSSLLPAKLDFVFTYGKSIQTICVSLINKFVFLFNYSELFMLHYHWNVFYHLCNKIIYTPTIEIYILSVSINGRILRYWTLHYCRVCYKKETSKYYIGLLVTSRCIRTPSLTFERELSPLHRQVSL